MIVHKCCGNVRICVCGVIRAGKERTTTWGNCTCPDCLKLKPNYTFKPDTLENRRIRRENTRVR